jgi:hypothetical protein
MVHDEEERYHQGEAIALTDAQTMLDNDIAKDLPA